MKTFTFIVERDEPEVIKHGFRLKYFNFSRYVSCSNIATLTSLDDLWRARDVQYMKMLDDCLTEFSDTDVLVASCINPFHPEWLYHCLPGTTKIYGCVDDPNVTYKRTINSLWAFDGAFYISPSYDRGLSLDSLLKLCGVKDTFWWPLSLSNHVTRAHRTRIDASWTSRLNDVVYVGKLYGEKFDRLVLFKRALGKKFSIYGKWELKGYAGFFGPLRGRRFLPYRVRAVSDAEFYSIHMSHKICLNMHLNDRRETGNQRMYQAPYHGAMLLCDKAADDVHAQIFEPDVEAVFYEDIEDAIEKAKYYLKHDSLREKIARAGFERVCRDYSTDKCLHDFLNWANVVDENRRASSLAVTAAAQQ